ncbi:cupin domain-containing protein [Bacillus sp. HMF5848]|uniref:cupin domain-containing protein n=1 Tax=Bacillus sp. HMF5848 TaxID=2495421 RepID=UPI000F7683EB|nr:cupin domain-containing protein [Bacillus sp. HMF5848]RSK27697.1 cupin domain-containing protein [Bacillus sp. HMF5848]
MYNVPQSYPYLNSPVFNPNVRSTDQQLFESLQSAINREASAIDFYSRLANSAPNQHHKNDIYYTLECKRFNLQQFAEQYMTLTGIQPMYQINNISFRTYQDGLQKAYDLETEGYEEYQKGSLLTQHPTVRQVFLQAANLEQDNARRLESLNNESMNELNDFGTQPYVVDIEKATKKNTNYRTAIWTGEHFQVTLMSIDVGSDIGLEVHPNTDQFLRLEQGQGLVRMGDSKDNLDFERKVSDDFAVMVPAGKWHNIVNTGDKPLKLYVIYAPPEHPFGTVHKTKEDAMEAEGN